MKRMPLESWGVLLIGIGLLFFHTGQYWSATWLSKWMALIAVMSLIFSTWAARRTSWFYFPLFAYAFASIITLGLYPQSPYQTMFDEVTLLALQKNALVALAEVAAITSLFALLSYRMRRGAIFLLAAIWWLGVLSTLWLPRTGPYSAPNNGLWFGNPSMGASLLACLLPFAWQVYGRRRGLSALFIPLSWGATLWAIVRTQASVPWGVLGVVTAASWFCAKGFKHWRWGVGTIAVLAAAMIGFGKHLLGYEFFNENGRTEIWRMAWDWFWQHANPAFGLGYSSSQILLPIEQTLTGHFHGFYFLWLHNDWLQLALEGGYVGMFCVFLALGRLVMVTWEDPALFGSFMGFVALGLFNYPLRMPMHSICLTLVCALAEISYQINRSGGARTLSEWPSPSARCTSP